jgi:hypothetical protein
MDLVNKPALAEQIAQKAWRQAEKYNLNRRSNEILSLIRHVEEQRTTETGSICHNGNSK